MMCMNGRGALRQCKVYSTNCQEDQDYIRATYTYQTTSVKITENGHPTVSPRPVPMIIRTRKTPGRLGVMVVGLGGNNSTTLIGTVIANRLGMQWRTKSGIQQSNYFGSLSQAGTINIGLDERTSCPVYVPFNSLLPMVDPSSITFDGWDISKMNMADAMVRAQVFSPELMDQIKPHVVDMVPRPSVFDVDFVAANQESRADNVIAGNKSACVMTIRANIRDFKSRAHVDKVIVLWMANTERFCEIRPGLNQTAEELLLAIQADQKEISPSTLFGVAAVLEGCAYINGSPQNTFVPGLIDLATTNRIPIIGDDLKTGQTKIKSVLVDFLVSAGIKPLSIVSYNHLGNNDGLNLSAEVQFKSKEITKSSVIDDAVMSNGILYPTQKRPDHCIVIKYVPEVGDSKRAMDEYVNEIAMGGRNTLVIHNTCEDSLLAVGVILDLLVFTELFWRMEFEVANPQATLSMPGNNQLVGFHPMYEIYSVLSYLCKAPLMPSGKPVVNGLFSQRLCLENIVRAAVGLPPSNHMILEHKLLQFLSYQATFQK